MSAASEIRQPLSAILRDLAGQEAPTVSVEQLMERFGGRAIGAVLLVFGLICTLPLPPGSTTLFGAPLVLLAPQLIVGGRVAWLPANVRRRGIATADLRLGLPRVLPWLERVEAVSKPRLAFLFGAVGQRLIGVVCTVLALVLILPIPLGNILPAAAVSVLSLALVQRDGLLALVGYALVGASVGVLVLAAGIINRGAHQLISLFTAA
ncbi:exopolysaccharide biosynthesis protein [Phenylobacterium hankyongense]|uniref:Exopolysaccharide biosynthesis protein n=1 Tax=Phenylobacterium hankyongense TaxID=1813876 RepID=A0A328AX45_9CAUL|nr:exopolysaccharide biosynthesis protein [Phenylobacterium hankyongense]RAK59660.1 exopolysaccharide biosynthesis protein [Phenylobacterium hankyongense]